MTGLIATIRTNSIKYGHTITSYDLLKCAAILLMTFDHIGYYLLPTQLWWRVVGRICVPIWFFLAGYGKVSKPERELYWLSAFLIIAHITFATEIFPVNILVTIMLARWSVAYMATRDKDGFMVIIFTFACLALLPITIQLFEYGTQVFLFTLAGYYRKHLPLHWLGSFALSIGCLLYIPLQAFSFAMPTAHAFVMMLSVIAICVLLRYFRVIQYPTLSNTPVIAPTLRLLGRNTQYYYVFHVVLLLAVAYVIYPRVWQIKWFGF